MSTGVTATPGATLPRKTPRKPRVRKHGTTEKVEETDAVGIPKTGEEIILEILGRLDTNFDRLEEATDSGLEDIIDLISQLHSVLDHHPEHGNLIAQIGGMQLQLKKVRKRCETKVSAIETEMSDVQEAINAMDPDTDFIQIDEKKKEIAANKDKLLKCRETNTLLDTINFELFGVHAKVLDIIKDGGVTGAVSYTHLTLPTKA